MKKLAYYLIFLLAIAMMVLCSSACRSPKTMTYNKATTDSLNLSVKDSTNLCFEFTFDSLELWTERRNFETSKLRNSQAQPSSDVPNLRSSRISHHIVVYGGNVNAEQSKLTLQDSTSSKKAQEIKTTRIRPDPLPIFIVCGIFALIYVLYRYKKKP